MILRYNELTGEFEAYYSPEEIQEVERKRKRKKLIGAILFPVVCFLTFVLSFLLN